MSEIQKFVEIKFLKSCSYEKINEMMNQLSSKIPKKLSIDELKEQFNKTGTNGFNTKPLWDGWLSCARANNLIKDGE